MSLFVSQANGVVQAGAGSGKTHSLVGICLHLLGGIGRAGPLAPARLCAVTFTEKAAAELQSRLRTRLDRLALASPAPDGAEAKALAETEPELFASCAALGISFPAQEIWQRARRDLGDAEIGTLHGVCTRILRRHAAAAGLDPAFTVLDALDAQLLLAEACERSVLDALEGEGPLRDAAERLCAEKVLRRNGRFGNGVADELFQLAANLGESGRTPEELVAKSRGLDREAADSAFEEAKREVEDSLTLLESALAAAKRTDAIDRSRSGLAHFRAASLRELQRTRPGELAAIWPAIAQASVGLRKTQSEHGQAAGLFKDSLAALEEADAAVRACTLARDLAALATRAVEQHRAEKLRRRALEFDDLTRLARELLARDLLVRRAEKERIEALLVDEFQDTSRAQLELCGWLAEERGAEGSEPAGSGRPGSRPFARGLLFLVGDRKQSIYEFRGADLEAAQAFADAAVRDGAERHFLRTSWRSLPPLVSFSNRLFEHLLRDAREPFQAPFISGEDDLSPSRKSAANVDAPCAELLEVEGDLDDEAAAVARRIAELLSPQASERVHDSDSRERPIRGGDIAVLMRSFLPVEALRRALLRARIPHVIVGGRLFHEAREILDLRALLTLALDRDDAGALAAVLRSPFGPISDDGLALLARAPRRDRTGSYHPGRGLTRHALEDRELIEKLAPDDAAALNRLTQLVARLHRETDRLGPSALLEAALAESRYRAAIAGGLFGEQAAANVERLLEMARSLELETARPAGALRALLARLNALESLGGGEGEAAIVEEKSAHAVRLLTVHAAKGLEFPIVLVPLSALQPPQGSGLIVDPELGLALRLKGPSGDTRWGAAGRRVYLRREAREQAQSLRLLYVAATRARDRVIFSGRTAKRKEASPTWWTLLKEAASTPQLQPLARILDARTLAVPARRETPALINSLAELERKNPPVQPPIDLQQEQQIAAQLARSLKHGAPENRGTLIAPVTQLANAALCPRRYQLLHELRLDEHPGLSGDRSASGRARASPAASEPLVADPFADEFADEPALLDAAERGTLAHKILEQIPLDPALSEIELRAAAMEILAGADPQLFASGGADAKVSAQASRDRSMSAGESSSLSAELVAGPLAFLSGDFAKRLRAAPERLRHRELPFALQLVPQENDPPGPSLLLRGQIDLLLLEASEALLLDYKLTERREPETYAFQLDAYALAAHRLIEGRLPVRSGLVFLKAKGAPVVLRGSSSDSDHERVRKSLLAAAQAIVQGRAQSHFAKIAPEGCRAIECGFLRRCHPDAADQDRP